MRQELFIRYQLQKGWIDAIDLRAGDILVRSNGEYVVVKAIEHELLESPITVYNFEVEDFHTYHVGSASVLVHNRCEGRPISPKKVTDNYIKSNKIDAHAFKAANGGKPKIASWDIYQDTASKGQLWLGDKTKKI